MGFTGLIFGAIAAAWLVYLVPFFLRRGDSQDQEADPVMEGAMAVTIVRSGESLAESNPVAVTVSTPLTRRSQLRELTMLDAQAAQRRRRVLIFLLLVQIAVAVLAAVGIGDWWVALIPSALIVAFLVIARFSVRAMRADFARRAEKIRGGAEEDTAALSLTELDLAAHEHSIELSLPVGGPGSLWDPVPIARPTYMSSPLGPRTVRTIDLAAPVPIPGVPVTADPIVEPVEPAAPDQQRNEDVG